MNSPVPPSADRPPSVDKLARSITKSGLPHPVAVEVARAAIADGVVAEVEDRARRRRRQMLTPVINATGVLLHTNLGRAPLGMDLGASYSNLELSLDTGKRGSRQAAIGSLLATATGAEAAMVVNNCASAVLLTLAALATESGRPAAAPMGVAVSRGEMVEIGGGFRIPDVMAQSGARLVEVGTTNRCRAADYQRAVDQAEADGDPMALLLKVHRSNYKVVGFTEDTSVAELASIGAAADLPVVADLGSGLLDATCPWLSGPPPGWLADEPAVRQTLEAGADLVLFSGDKLFGGPQAGIIAGRADLVARCGAHPLARALRPGSLVMHALQETTMAYLDRRGGDIALWSMVATPVADLEARAKALLDQVGADRVGGGPLSACATEAVPGGGTLPTVTFPSFGVRVSSDVTDGLRQADRPVIARVADGATILDLRTVDPADDETVAAALRTVLADTPGQDR